VNQEDAMVGDHDTANIEVWGNGQLVGRFTEGLAAQAALRRVTGAQTSKSQVDDGRTPLDRPPS
jgi:hypothetical protein